jgi:hypothetical protein
MTGCERRTVPSRSGLCPIASSASSRRTCSSLRRPSPTRGHPQKKGKPLLFPGHSWPTRTDRSRRGVHSSAVFKTQNGRAVHAQKESFSRRRCAAPPGRRLWAACRRQATWRWLGRDRRNRGLLADRKRRDSGRGRLRRQRKRAGWRKTACGSRELVDRSAVHSVDILVWPSTTQAGECHRIIGDLLKARPLVVLLGAVSRTAAQRAGLADTRPASPTRLSPAVAAACYCFGPSGSLRPCSYSPAGGSAPLLSTASCTAILAASACAITASRDC